MARPPKMRKVCCAPCKNRFGLLGEWAGNHEVVRLTVDEYETIRLIDYEGLLQEQCAEKMQVARTTVQAIYVAARKKLATMIVEGRPLCIEGGNFRLCEGTDEHCLQKGCCRHQRSAEGNAACGTAALTPLTGASGTHHLNKCPSKLCAVEQDNNPTDKVDDTQNFGGKSGSEA